MNWKNVAFTALVAAATVAIIFRVPAIGNVVVGKPSA